MKELVVSCWAGNRLSIIIYMLAQPALFVKEKNKFFAEVPLIVHFPDDLNNAADDAVLRRN